MKTKKELNINIIFETFLVLYLLKTYLELRHMMRVNNYDRLCHDQTNVRILIALDGVVTPPVHEFRVINWSLRM